MKSAAQRYSRHVSVPAGEGTRVEKIITINRPVAEVYSYWRRLENLPRFMRHLESVTERDDLHSHWVVKGPAGKRVEWDAEIIEQRENEMISWRSAPGADVDNAGSVWFSPVNGGRATRLRVELKYVPPAGIAGALISKIFGRDAEAEINTDLRRLKSLLETGRVPENENSDWQARAAEITHRVARASNEYVRENTWTVIASLAIGCFVLGFLAGRSGRRD